MFSTFSCSTHTSKEWSSKTLSYTCTKSQSIQTKHTITSSTDVCNQRRGLVVVFSPPPFISTHMHPRAFILIFFIPLQSRATKTAPSLSRKCQPCRRCSTLQTTRERSVACSVICGLFAFSPYSHTEYPNAYVCFLKFSSQKSRQITQEVQIHKRFWVGGGDFEQQLRNWQLSNGSIKDKGLHTLERRWGCQLTGPLMYRAKWITQLSIIPFKVSNRYSKYM